MRWYLHATPRDVACSALVGRVAENGPDVLPLNLIAIVPFCKKNGVLRLDLIFNLILKIRSSCACVLVFTRTTFVDEDTVILLNGYWGYWG
jgi:hypothetical protein